MPMMARSPLAVALAMFAAQVLGMASFITFPALLPGFQAEWRLSNAEAGWIAGVFFAGFVASTPVLTTLTDRFDPKRIFLAGMAITALSSLGFSVFADGLWSATLWRIVHGIGYGACYMPGMKALSDAVPPAARDRAVALFSATYTIGVSFSFFVSGPAAAALGWRDAYLVFTLGPLAGFLLAASMLPAAPKRAPAPGLFDFKPILRSRSALSYMFAYFIHNGESSTIRAFAVSFLVMAFAVSPPAGIAAGWDPVMIVAIANLFGLPAIMLANELARLGARNRAIGAIMLASGTVGLLMALAVPWGAVWVIALMMLHGFLVPADVGSINAGLVGIVPEARRGAAMALHAVCGFTGALVAPVLFGALLDLAGGRAEPAAWSAAFTGMLALILTGPLVLAWLGRGLGRATTPEK
jgi:MFS family permease